MQNRSTILVQFGEVEMRFKESIHGCFYYEGFSRNPVAVFDATVTPIRDSIFQAQMTLAQLAALPASVYLDMKVGVQDSFSGEVGTDLRPELRLVG